MPAYKDDATGKWYASFKYRDWTGANKRKIKRGFATRRAALEWQRAFLDKAAGTPDMAFKALYSLYMEDCKARLRPTTYAGKEFLFQKMILPFFQDKAINAISPADVRKWQNTLLNASYRPHTQNGRKEAPRRYTPTYLKTVHNQLSAAFNFAMKYYRLPTNPARMAGSMGKKRADAMQFWTVDEFRQFIAAFPTDSMAYAAFSLLFWSGMRSGELLALTVSDIDFKAGTVSINKSYSRLNGVDLIQPPKTPKSVRTITLPPFMLAILRQYINTLYKAAPRERLFEATKSWLTVNMARGCEKTGVKKIRIHDLRHSHASLLIDMGFSPLLIKERLGHENIETTLQTYSHLYPSRTDEMVEKLQEKWKA